MTVEKFQHSLAVVIGIDDYSNGVPSLKTPVNDAQTLATILKDRHGYDVKLLLNQAASGTALKNLLETELPQQLSKEHRLLFYFAGHGIALNGDDGPEGYLIPSDASLGDISTYLSMATVNQALLKLPCRHFLGILDCCFAGAFRWSSTRKLVAIELGTLHKERYDRFIRDPAWQVITSAASDQLALDAFDLKSTKRGLQGNHSPFAAALIEALEGSADAYPPAEAGKPAGDGVITATELYLYLRDRVEPDTATRAMRQTPGIFPLTRHDKGEFIFLAPGHPLNLPPAPPMDESSNPYRGLESFDEAHKDLFFGRQALTQTLAEFVTNHPLTVVLGASGSGKSSLVKAGLIPTLQQADDWAFLSPFRPGESPLKALNQLLQVANLPEIAPAAEAVSSGLLTPAQGLSLWSQAHPHTHLLVVVDQFEELITLCRDQQERQNFLEVLAEAIATHSTQLHLVLTLRSDFEPQFRNTALEPDWQGARFVVPAMTRDELRQAIEAPASARVMVFDPHELVDQLIDEVANMPGALPLLSFALSELYLNYLKRQKDARDNGDTLDRAMTQADYEAMGGVTQSLTQRAEHEYEQLINVDLAYAHTIRNVMLRMVSIGGELARRRVPEVELVYPDAAENGRVEEAIKQFEEARLLTPDTDPEGKPYKEPAHDALVRGWPRLLDWKQEHLRELLLQRDLTSDANQWERSDKKKQDSGLLWIEDPRLPTALQLSCGKDYKDNWLNLFRWRFGYQTWQSQTPEHWLNTSEMDFVGQSFDQKFKRFRNTSIIVAGVILTLSGLTGYALVQQELATRSAQEANRQKDEATKQAGIALNNQKKAEANQKEATKQAGIALNNQKKAEANQKEATKQAGIALNNQKKAETNQKEATKQAGIAKEQAGIALNNQKKAEDNQKEAEKQTGIAQEQQKIALGRQLVAQASALESQQSSLLQRSMLLAIESLNYNPSVDAKQILREGLNLLPRPLWKGVYKSPINRIVSSPNGKYLATIDRDQIVQIRELSTGEIISSTKYLQPIENILFDKKGELLVISSGSNISFFNSNNLQQQYGKFDHGEIFEKIIFNSTNGVLITKGPNYTSTWDVSNHKHIHSLKVSQESNTFKELLSLWDTFGVPSNHTEISISANTLDVWDEDGNSIQLSKTNEATIKRIAENSPRRDHDLIPLFSPSGKYIAFSRITRIMVPSFAVFDLERKNGEPIYHDEEQPRLIKFSPDGKYLAWRHDESNSNSRFGGLIKILDLKQGSVKSWSTDALIESIGFSHDSQYLFVVTRNQLAHAIDVKNQQEIMRSVNFDFDQNSREQNSFSPVIFDSSGRYLITVDNSSKVLQAWSVDDMRDMHELKVDSIDRVWGFVFSPSGHHLITAGIGIERYSKMTLWDITIGSSPISVSTIGDLFNIIPEQIEFSSSGKIIIGNDKEYQFKINNQKLEPVNGRDKILERCKTTAPTTIEEKIGNSPDFNYLIFKKPNRPLA